MRASWEEDGGAGERTKRLMWMDFVVSRFVMRHDLRDRVQPALLLGRKTDAAVRAGKLRRGKGLCGSLPSCHPCDISFRSDH